MGSENITLTLCIEGMLKVISIEYNYYSGVKRFGYVKFLTVQNLLFTKPKL